MQRIVQALLLVLILASAVPAAAPKLVADSPVHDFGSVYQGERVDHTFHFRNEGDAPLHIAKVRSSCGCTAALLSDEVIPPGETGEVKASFDSTRFRGEVSKSIYLYSDDPRSGTTQFVLRGIVREELAVTPQQIVIRDLPQGQRRTVELTLMNRGDRELALAVPVQTSSPDLEAKVAGERLAPGQSTTLQVTLSPPPTAARLSGYVFLRTADGRIPEVRIPVQVTLQQN